MIYAFGRRGDRHYGQPITDADIDEVAEAVVSFVDESTARVAAGRPFAPGCEPPVDPVTGRIQRSADSLALVLNMSIERIEAICAIMNEMDLAVVKRRDLTIGGVLKRSNLMYVGLPSNPHRCDMLREHAARPAARRQSRKHKHKRTA